MLNPKKIIDLGQKATRKAAKAADEGALSAIRAAGRKAHEEQASSRAAINEQVAEQLAKLPARSKKANEELGLYHPIGGGLKLSKPVYGFHATTVPDPMFNPPKIGIITPEQLVKEEAALFPLVGDRAAAGKYLTHIGETELETPVRLTGGSRYMDANYNLVNPEESAAWESAAHRVTALGRQAARAGEGGRPVYGVYTAGSATNTDFNVMGANALLQQIPHSKISKKAEREFDRAMREGSKIFPPIPDWPGIRSPEAQDMIMNKNNGIIRTKLFDVMGKENFQSMGFPDVAATRKAIVEPDLLDVSTNQAGYRLARMDPTGRIIENPLIPSDYPVAMAGQVAGQLDLPADYKDIWQTHFDARRLLSQPESGDYYSFSKAHPIQYADDEWLNRLREKQYAIEQKIKEGKAEGGEAKRDDEKPVDHALKAWHEKQMAGGGIAKVGKVIGKAVKKATTPAFGGSYDNAVVRRAKEEFVTTHGMDVGQSLSKDYDFINIDKIKPAEKVNEKRVKELMNALEEEDPFNTKIPPVIIDSEGNVLDGHHRIEAAKRLGIKSVPAIEKFETQSGTRLIDAIEQSKAKGGVVDNDLKAWHEKKMAQGGEVRMQEGGKTLSIKELMMGKKLDQPEMKALPQTPIQAGIGWLGQKAESLGKTLGEATGQIKETHPIKAAIGEFLVSDPLQSAGTALQDWTGTPREVPPKFSPTGEEIKGYQPTPGPFYGGSKATLDPSTWGPALGTFKFDPRALDVMGFAQLGGTAATKAAKTLGKAADILPSKPLPVGLSTESVGPKGEKVSINELIRRLEAGEEMTPAERQKAEYSKAQKEKYAQANIAKAQKEPAPKEEEVRVPATEQGFFSSVEKAAANLKREEGSGDAFLSDIMKFNPSKGELEATGIVDFLKGKENLTKQDIVDYINNNQIQIEEVVRGRTLSKEDQRRFDDMNRKISQGYGHYLTPEEEDWFEATAAKVRGSKAPRFEDERLILPGGTNYKELLLKFPYLKTEDLKAAQQIEDQLRKETVELRYQYRMAHELDPNSQETRDLFQKLKEAHAAREEASFKVQEIQDKNKGQNYESSHWPGDPNTFAHVRMQDMDIGGKRTLMIEEIQSDWHQEGRGKGYRKDLTPAEREEMQVLMQRELREEGFGGEDAARLQELIQRPYTGGVPDAPFKKDWYQLAIKRIMKYAADNDYDQVALVGPEEQIRRSSLSTYVDGLNFQKNKDGTIKIDAEKDGSIVFNDTVKPEDLDLYVSKDVAKRILESKETDGTLTGDDLKVGGEGMRQYYDRNYPKYLEKQYNKYGINLRKKEITTRGFGPDDIEVEGTGEVDRYGRETMGYTVRDPESGDVVGYGSSMEEALNEANRGVQKTDIWVMDLPAKMKSDVKIGQSYKKGGLVVDESLKNWHMKKGGSIKKQEVAAHKRPVLGVVSSGRSSSAAPAVKVPKPEIKMAEGGSVDQYAAQQAQQSQRQSDIQAYKQGKIGADELVKHFPGMTAAMVEAQLEPEQKMAKGGEVRMSDGGNPADYAEQMVFGTPPEDQKPAGQAFKDIGTDLVRGAKLLPFDVLGAPVDLATMAMRPFGYDVEKPAGGSEWLIDKAVKAGLMEEPTDSAAELASRIGLGVAGPGIAKGVTKAGKALKTPEKPITTEIGYETAQEGPFYRVKPQSIKGSGAKDRGVKEEVSADTSGRPVGGDVSQRVPDEDVSAVIKDPNNFVKQSANQYSQQHLGHDYTLPEMPPSSLAKQSAIGRTFQLAAEDDPSYKKAVFNAYGRQYPELVEQSGAQNYDQLLEAAYRQLAKETKQQFESLPVNMSFHRAGEGNYGDSKQMLQDIFKNRHLYVFQGGDPHTFLNVVDPKTGLNTNEMFRAVHDFYGHAVHGNPFGPKGEEIAYAAHAQMFSPLARMAMAAETRGQNSFVNYTPLNAELKAAINQLQSVRYEASRRGDKASADEAQKQITNLFNEFRFAPQKSVLLPPEFLDVQYRGGMPDYLQSMIKPQPGTTTSEFLTHFSQSPSLSMLDPARYGTGIKGEEAARLGYTLNPVKERTYFYTGEPSQIRPEPGLGPYRYGAMGEGLYDVAADPAKLGVIAAEANRIPFTSLANKGLTDPAQVTTDLERLVKEYGYQGLVNPQQGVGLKFTPTPVKRFAKGGLSQIKK